MNEGGNGPVDEGRDLRDLLHGAAAASGAGGGLGAGALTGRIRRGRAVRTGMRSVAGVAAASVLVLAVAQVPSLLSMSSSSDSAVQDEAGADSGAAVAGGAAACGDAWGDGGGTPSTVDGRVRVTAVPATTSAAGAGALDAAVVVGSSFTDAMAMSFGGAQVVLVRDGVVASSTPVDADDLTDLSLSSQENAFVWTSVPLTACDDVTPLDGEYELWVRLEDGSGAVVGGGVPVRVVDGAVPSLCGTRLDDAVETSDEALAIEGQTQLGTIDDAGKFVPDGTDTLWLSASVDARPGQSDAGAYDGPRLVLTDGSGTVVLDSAASPHESRSASWYDLPDVGLGGELYADATTCGGEPLPQGDYEAWDVLTLASWDAAGAGGRTLAGSAGGFSFGSGSSAG